MTGGGIKAASTGQRYGPRGRGPYQSPEWAKARAEELDEELGSKERLHFYHQEYEADLERTSFCQRDTESGSLIHPLRRAKEAARAKNLFRVSQR